MLSQEFYLKANYKKKKIIYVWNNAKESDPKKSSQLLFKLDQF